MTKFIKYLKNYLPYVIIILVLLVVQAYCNLALPSYTSDIVDIGIERGGIENAAAEQISDATMDNLMLFMSEEEQLTVKNGYTLRDGIWTLVAAGDEKERIASVLEAPMSMVYKLSDVTETAFKEQLSSQLNLDSSVLADKSIDEIGQMLGISLETSMDEDGNRTVNMLPIMKAMIKAGKMDASSLIAMKDNMVAKLGDSGELILSSLSVEFVKMEYDRLDVDQDAIQKDYLYSVAAKMLEMTIVMAIAAVIAGYLASYVAAKNSQDLREKMFGKVLSFSNNEIDKFSTASLITRCTNDIQQVQMTMVILLRVVLYAPILAIGGIIKVLSVKTGLTWIIIVASLAMTGLILGLLVVSMPKFKIMQKMIDRVNLVSREILDGILVIRAFGREKYEEKRFDDANKDLMKTQLFTNRVMTFMMPLMMFIMNGVNLLIIWFGAKSIDNGMMQIGSMVAFMTYALEIIMAFIMIEMVSIMLPRASVAAERIDEVINTTPVITDKDNCARFDSIEFAGTVDFDHVTFRYPGAEDPVLKDITFTAQPGKTTAIIGSTGCGKSSLMNLIPRFYDVSEGAIRIDGVDIREMSQQKLRSLIGLVPQKGFLFSGTIESNLKYAGNQVDDARMMEAASIAQATEFIDQKPEQYQSPIAQGGTNVSGGQKQRLSIARALAKKAPILLFDDSFSALDYKTDIALRKVLRKKLNNSTVIIIAQRISTVLHADQIIVLYEGKICGIGTHNELMKSCKVYQEIAKSQLSENELQQNGGVA